MSASGITSEPQAGGEPVAVATWPDGQCGTARSAGSCGNSDVAWHTRSLITAGPGIPSGHYLCPGERRPITRAVHLARLADSFPACRDCAHRHDSGGLPPRLLHRLDVAPRPVDLPSLVQSEGVRGVFLNDLTRPRAERLAEAVATLLWEAQPHVAKDLTARRSAPQPRRRGPTVVIAHDQRPSSPEMAIGLATGLRRMGCQVIDAGRTSTPCFQFAVMHLHAAAGVYVTGQGCGPSWTGIDLVGGGAVSWSRPGRLDAVADRLSGPIARPTRQGGTQRSFQASVPYEAGLRTYFHALRPLRIGFASASPIVAGVFDRLFAELPCTLFPVDWGARPTTGGWFPDQNLRRLGDHVHDGRLDLGFAVAEDGQACQLLDETGEPIPAEDLTARFADLLSEEYGAVTIAGPDGTCAAPSTSAASDCGSIECHAANSFRTREEIAGAVKEGGAHLGADGAGRYWFRDAAPQCDGALTLAAVLQILSRNDHPASSAFRS